MRNDELALVLDSLREEIHIGHTLTRATVKAEIDRVDEKADRIIKHNEKQNGRLAQHDDIIQRLSDYQEHCPANKVGKALNKKWIWIAALLLFILTSFTSAWLSQNVDWLKTAEKAIGIELIEDGEGAD